MWKCPKCETLNNDETTCVICGEIKPEPTVQTQQQQQQQQTPVPPTPPTPPVPPPMPPMPKRRNTAPIVVLSLVVVLLLGVVAFLLMQNQNAAEEPSHIRHEQYEIPSLVPEPSETPYVEDAPVTTPTPTPKPENTTVTATYYVVNCEEWITLRSAPDTQSASLTKIPLGESVGYIEPAGNGFYKVKYQGIVGYALSSYLSASKPQPKPVSYTMRVVNCEEWITLRDTASTSGASLTKIPLGATVTYLSDAGNGFYQVQYSGMTGYALSQYLRFE